MRKICWFSCGAPSAVAAKLAVTAGPCLVAYTQVAEEHPDNLAFLRDCANWLGQLIVVLGNWKYDCSIYEVFRRERYLVGFNGAPCTKLLKRKMREEFQLPDDIHVLGYTFEERDRVASFSEHFPELKIETPLIEAGLTKADCLAMIQRAGIKLPAMYLLGYNNNNCIGCVKGGKGYWNKIRVDFPETFDRMAKLERELNYAITGTFLDELSPDAGRDVPEPKIECSLLCAIAEKSYE